MNRESRLKSYHARKLAEKKTNKDDDTTTASSLADGVNAKTVETKMSSLASTATPTAATTAAATATTTAATTTADKATTATNKMKMSSSNKANETKKLFAARRRAAQIEMQKKQSAETTAAVIECDVESDDKKDVAAVGDVAMKMKMDVAMKKDKGDDDGDAVVTKGDGANKGSSTVAVKKEGTTKTTNYNNHNLSYNSRRAMEMMRRKHTPAATTTTTTTTTTIVESVTEADEVKVGIESKSTVEDIIAVKDERTSQESSTSSSTTTTNRKTVRFADGNPQCSPPRIRKEITAATAAAAVVVNNSETDASGEQVTLQKEDKEDSKEEEEEDDDSDFLLFVKGLKREVAGDHTELWAGFQSLLNVPMDQRAPLYEEESPTVASSNNNDNSTNNNNNNNPADKKKKRRVRMDPTTQASLTLIHQTLANEDRIKNGFVKTCSQLVNDRGVKKGRMLEKEKKKRMEEEEEKKKIESKREGLDCITEMKEVDVYNNGDVDRNATEDVKKPTWINSYKKKKNLYLSSYAASSSNSSNSSINSKSNVSPTTSISSSLKEAPSIASSKTSMSSFKSYRSSKKNTSTAATSSLSSSSTKSKMPTWLEALKKKQKSLRSSNTNTTKLGSVKNDEEEPLVFQLSPRKRPKITPPTSPQETVAATVPWANVKLRSTPKKGAVEMKGDEDNDTAVLNNGNHIATTGTSMSNRAVLFSAGDIILLDSLPDEAFVAHETETFPLKTSKWSEGQEDDGTSKRIVIVGKDVVVTATRLADEPNKASVLWWSHRCDIRSLTLNVDATGATLSLIDRPSIPLAFPSADVCLNFAQYFLRGPPTTTSSSSPKSASLEISPSTETEATVLTAEEESLLDTYRKFSQSDRTKLKLTCSSPKGEDVEMEVNLSPRIMTGKINESVPEKYGKMLGMGIPPDAVRHKMTMDGVNPSIVKLVVDPAEVQSASNCNGKGLSSDEEAVADKYRKMLKMGVPPDGVRHKMNTEGVDSKIIAAVLDAPVSKVDAQGLTKEEESVASKYRRMLKMGVPPDGVRHKMTTEGVNPKIIEVVLAVPSESQKPESNQQLLSGEEEVIASKYRKMLKMRIPLDAVKHKMTQDGVDQKIVSVIVSEATGDDAKVPPTPVVPRQKSPSNAPALTEEEEKEASKYRMMIKVCIPKEAIRHDMKKEGVSDKIIEAVLGAEWVNVKDDSKTSKPKEFNRKTIQFHWTTSNLPPELLQQSIFGKAEDKKRKIATINPEESDIKKLEELFQKRDNSAAAKKKAAGADEAGGGMAKLLDLTRANNIAISLKKFNDFTFRSLAETIDDLDPHRKIVGERVQFIPNLLPTPKEMVAIKKFKGDDDKLITAELFFKHLVSVKRIEDKVQVMKTMHFFKDHVAEVREGFKTLQEVCNQVLNSEKLLKVLQMVLNIGNLLNEGTLNGGVDAFKFESLSKLSQTKSADGKTTVLDYIVETFISKGERDVLNLLTEFPDIQESSRLSIGDLISEMNSLRKDYNLCKTELTKMKNDQSSKRVTRSMAKKINNESEAGDPRKALFAAITARATKKEEPAADPRQALFAAIKSRKQESAEDNNESIDTADTEYTPGVKRLQDFLQQSKTVISLADSDQDAAIRACKGLAVYCGEGGGEQAAAPLLQILCEFATSLDTAMKKYDARLVAEAKRAAKLAREKNKENQIKTTSTTPKKLLRASAFQPHVGVTDKVKIRSPLRQESSLDVREALFNAIKSDESKPKRKTAKPIKEKSKSKQALLADIKNGKKPSELKESRILLVNRMLQDAPANVKRDFLRGVTYEQTDDPLLRKIYEKESYSPKSS